MVLSTKVSVELQNNVAYDVNGTVTVTLKTAQNPTGTTKTSDVVTVPAQQSIWTVVDFSSLEYDPAFATSVSFTAQTTSSSSSTSSSTSGTGTSGSNGNGYTYANTSSGGAGFNFASLTLPVSAVVVVLFCAVGGVFVLKKRGVSEQKVKRFTSYELQDWVLQRLHGHAGSVLDSRKGIDGFTGDNLPIAIKQSDSLDRLQVDIFMNTLIQAKLRSGIIVAFGFTTEANAAVSRAKMNRIDIKLVTVKELIDHKETALM